MNISNSVTWLIASAVIAGPLSAQARPVDAVSRTTDPVPAAALGTLDRPVTPGRDRPSLNPELDRTPDRPGLAGREGEPETDPAWSTVPEPATMVLLATGLGLLAAVPIGRRLRARRQD
jgi:PEP-CTERM motif